MSEGIFESSVRSAGDLAGVFECDDDTGYFYFFDKTRGEGDMILAATQITKGPPPFGQSDVKIEWNQLETAVGLVIRKKLWAAFDERAKSYSGGLYSVHQQPVIPCEIKQLFEHNES